MPANVVITVRDTPPKADLNPPLWAESGLVFNFLASYSARNCTCISPSASNTRPSRFPDCRTCDRFAYFRNPQCVNIHNLFKWDYQTNSDSNSCFLPQSLAKRILAFCTPPFMELRLDNRVMPSPFEMTANTNTATIAHAPCVHKIRSFLDLQCSSLCTFHPLTTWNPKIFFFLCMHYINNDLLIKDGLYSPLASTHFICHKFQWG